MTENMGDMQNSPAHAKREPGDWTAGQKWYTVLLIVLPGMAIAAIAFTVIYGRVTAFARPYLPRMPWALVVSCEIAFVFLFNVGILLAWRKAPNPASRAVFMCVLMAGSVLIQVYAAHGNRADMLVYLVVLCAFFAVILTGKAAYNLLRGTKIRADRVGVGEWLAHPVHSFRLVRWMATWGEPSRKAAHDRYMRLLYAIAIAQADPAVGSMPLLWRHRLPVTLRYQFSTGLLPEGGKDWQQSIADHVRKQLRPPAGTPAETSSGHPAGPPAGSPAGYPSGQPSRTPRQRQPVSAVKRAQRLGRKAADADLLDAMREMAAEGREPTKTRVIDELPVGKDRADRLVAAYHREMPTPISAAKARA